MPLTAHPNWPLAPSWALFVGSFGRGLVLLALLCFSIALVSEVFPSVSGKFPRLSGWTFRIGASALFMTIVALGTLFVNDQFEYGYVFSHGDRATELRYKIAGIWSGQEGSFLLWACTSSLFGWLALGSTGIYRRWFLAAFSLFLATLCGILAYETPFTLALLNGVAVLPPQGAGLTPSLQNHWVVIHPPTIFLGFGSLAVAAAYGFSAMMSRNLVDWARQLRPWAIASTSILGLGLCMGGFWAYETLGWGGFWMWDPVENVSFVPWIFSIALLHGLIVQSTKKQWLATNLILAGLPFLTFCYGTFLTRSGFLSSASVHSFAQMNQKALYILIGFLAVSVFTYFGLLMRRGWRLAKSVEITAAPTGGVDRQKMYASGVMLLSGLATATAIGMSIPFFLALVNKDSKVVDEPLYHQVVVWFFIPIMLLLSVAPFVSWRQMGAKALWARIGNVVALTFGLLGFCLLIFRNPSWGVDMSDQPVIPLPFHLGVPLLPWMMILVGVCLLAVVANSWRIYETYRGSSLSIGGFIAHMGLAILMSGLIISRGLERKEQVLLQEGDTVKALDYVIDYRGMTHSETGGLYNRDNKVLLELTGKDSSFSARPGLYYIHNNTGGPEQAMTWPDISHGLTYDVYLELHPPQNDVWADPVTFQMGETKDVGGKGIEVHYKNYRMIGPGGIGTKFMADLGVRVQGQDKVWRYHVVHPALEITAKGITPLPWPIDDQLMISMQSLNAGDHAADFQVHLIKPVYPIDLFYKPMVLLVWLGAGVMTFGGLLAAYYRRFKPTAGTAPLTLDRGTEEDSGIPKAVGVK